ncbi:uncharacterized protein At4g02000-like [Quercus suber]|uniref:uncharacterized protein At4g02000-like n=1 Tax=Quercus suber TaxID=58331 RepID=UPI000CE1CBB0|nr:uncharacterized protein At4g02000-like [Quercus suber]
MTTRFLTKRPINLDSIANTFNPLWRPKTGFRMKFIGDHLILFSFNSKEDVDRILTAEPWSFDKHIMVLSSYDKADAVNPSDLNTMAFWIQVHDIPLRFRNKEVVEQICGVMGTVLKPKNSNDYDGGSFIRVRVALNISLPLCRGRRITLDNDEFHWVSFNYEHLPNFCYWCECLTHPDKDCERWIESEGSLGKEDQHFGPSMKAPPFMVSRKGFLTVPGFYANKKASRTDQPQAGPPNQPQKSPPTEAWEPSPKLPPKVTKKVVKHVSDNPSEVTSPFSEFPSPLPQFPTSDQQILRSDPAQTALNGNLMDHVSTLQNGPLTSNSPTTKHHHTEPSYSGPLKDITNSSSTHLQLDPDAEKKWVRMKRPNYNPNDEPLKTSLGKRTAQSSLENTQPLKRIAIRDDALPSPSPQTAAAGRQPRQAR